MTAEDVARSWIGKAEHDLTAARHLLGLKADCPHDTVCFHAQQTAEKYLKALLSYLQIEFPKTHVLGERNSLLPAARRLSLTATELRALSDLAVESRYPALGEEPTEADARHALETAERIKAELLKHLP